MIPEQMLKFLCLSRALEVFINETEDIDDEGCIKVLGEWYDVKAVQEELLPYFNQIMSPFRVEHNTEKSE